MSLPPATSENRSNFRHLYWDVLWYGVLSGSILSFLGVYAARLGGNSFQISLLSAGPAVVNLFLSLPAGSWLQGKLPVKATFWSAGVHRTFYLLLVALPFFLDENQLQVWTIVGITLLMAGPGTLLAISFNSMFAEVVPAEWRSEVVGRRNALMAFSSTASALLCGQLLDRIVFPLNYQVVFIIGAVGAALSTYHLGRIRYLRPDAFQDEQPASKAVASRLRQVWRAIRSPRWRPARQLLRLDLLNGAFGLFLLSYLLFYTFQYFPIPVFPVFFVDQLHLSDSAISLGSALFNAAMFLASLQVARFTTRFGHRRVLIVSAMLYCLYPLLLGLARSPLPYWGASLVGGVVWAFCGVALLNRLMEVVKEDVRVASMALHNLTLNLGILVGSLAAPPVGALLGLRTTLILAAVMRFLAGVIFGLWA